MSLVPVATPPGSCEETGVNSHAGSNDYPHYRGHPNGNGAGWNKSVSQNQNAPATCAEARRTQISLDMDAKLCEELLNDLVEVGKLDASDAWDLHSK